MTMEVFIKERTVELDPEFGKGVEKNFSQPISTMHRSNNVLHRESLQVCLFVFEKRAVELDLEFWTIKRLLSEGERTSQNTAGRDGPQGAVIHSLRWTMMSDVEFEVVFCLCYNQTFPLIYKTISK